MVTVRIKHQLLYTIHPLWSDQPARGFYTLQCKQTTKFIKKKKKQNTHTHQRKKWLTQKNPAVFSTHWKETPETPIINKNPHTKKRKKKEHFDSYIFSALQPLNNKIIQTETQETCNKNTANVRTMIAMKAVFKKAWCDVTIPVFPHGSKLFSINHVLKT